MDFCNSIRSILDAFHSHLLLPERDRSEQSKEKPTEGTNESRCIMNHFNHSIFETSEWICFLIVDAGRDKDGPG